MENYPISINIGKVARHFEVGEYLHHNGEQCKFRVFENGIYVASFEPGAHDFLHICQNPGKVNEDVLHLLAEQIESHHPQANDHHLKNIKL